MVLRKYLSNVYLQDLAANMPEFDELVRIPFLTLSEEEYEREFLTFIDHSGEVSVSTTFFMVLFC